MTVEVRKSKQISMLAEKVALQSFGTYGEILNRMVHEINDYVEGEDEEEAVMKENQSDNQKKVTFADIVDEGTFKSNHP